MLDLQASILAGHKADQMYGRSLSAHIILLEMGDITM
jgi:hypothetical protein